jgi:hypothetical protein
VVRCSKKRTPGSVSPRERGGPLVERQVRGHDGRATLIALIDELEKRLGAGLGKWDKVKFINDQ